MLSLPFLFMLLSSSVSEMTWPIVELEPADSSYFINTMSAFKQESRFISRKGIIYVEKSNTQYSVRFFFLKFLNLTNSESKTAEMHGLYRNT